MVMVFIKAIHKLRPSSYDDEQRHLEKAEGGLISLPHSRGGRSSTILVRSDGGEGLHTTRQQREGGGFALCG